MTELRTETNQEGGAASVTADPPRATKRRWWPFAVVSALYLALSLIWWGHLGSFSRTGPGIDDDHAQVWWLAWAASNFPHVSALFDGRGLNYPAGANFGVNGSMLALGVLFAPITKLFGVTVTWNVLLRLAPAVSACAMCFVLRRWTSWWPAAFVGGLLYGFSSYQVHASAYIFLVFVPLPPIFFLLLHEILVRQKWSPRISGLLLCLVCVFQILHLSRSVGRNGPGGSNRGPPLCAYQHTCDARSMAIHTRVLRVRHRLHRTRIDLSGRFHPVRAAAHPWTSGHAVPRISANRFVRCGCSNRTETVLRTWLHLLFRSASYLQVSLYPDLHRSSTTHCLACGGHLLPKQSSHPVRLP